MITHTYKKSRTTLGFYPKQDQAYKKPAVRAEEPLYAGHEDFPTPKMMKKPAAQRA